MAIPARQIVDVSPRVINAGVPDIAMSGLLLTKNALCLYPDMTFASANAVGNYFGMDSNEYKAAAKYFQSYDNSFKKPANLKFGKRIDSALAGSLIGGGAASLATLKTITAGTFKISINGTDVTVSSLDLSACASMSAVATALQAKITGTSVAYNSNLNAFIVTSSTTGATSAVAPAVEISTETTATQLGLTAAQGATAIAGSAALSEAENMNAIVEADGNWASFACLYAASDSEILALAEWNSEQKVEFLFVAHTDTAADAVPTNASNLPNSLINLDVEGTLVVFGNIYHAVLVMAIGASIDWNRYNGLPSFAFRTQSGLAASVTDETTAENLLTMKTNYYGRYASRVEDFTFVYNGAMVGGTFGYVDAYIGNIWLRNALQNAILNGLQQVPRTPYNDDGYNQIRAWCADPINRGINNGVIQKGVVLSEAQKAQLYAEIGINVADDIYTDGYYLVVQDPGAQARVNRESPVCGLWYTYGGQVNKVELPATVIL